MTSYLTAGLVVAGGFFGLLAAVGMLRLPDMITRMHASTKAGTLGAGLIMAGYITVEVLILNDGPGGPTPIEYFYFALGMAMAALAGYLWLAEKRPRRERAV